MLENIETPSGYVVRFTEPTMVELILDEKEQVIEVKVFEGWQETSFGIKRD